jgi:hypothetical protein
LRHFFALLSVLAALPAHATCLFARDTAPADWYEWAQVLVAADVENVERQSSTDFLALRVVETFKGPTGAQSVTMQVPNNLWAACRLEVPKVGERVLGALNANNDALVVPLTAEYAERLRAASPASAPR